MKEISLKLKEVCVLNCVHPGIPKTRNLLKCVDDRIVKNCNIPNTSSGAEGPCVLLELWALSDLNMAPCYEGGKGVYVKRIKYIFRSICEEGLSLIQAALPSYLNLFNNLFDCHA